MNRAIILASLMVFAFSSVFLLCSCAKKQVVTGKKEIIAPTKEEAKVEEEKPSAVEIAKKKEDYLEKQKISSELDPKNALYEKAYEFYEKARVTSKFPDSFTELGTNDKEGIKLLEHALKVNPYYHAAHYTLGKSYENTKEYEKAEQHFLKCIGLKPNNQDAYKSLANLYRDQKRYDEALEYYNKAINLGSREIWIFYSIGKIHLEKGNLHEAEEVCKEALHLVKEKNADDLSVVFGFQGTHGILAKVYLKKGDLKASWNSLKKSGYWEFSEAEIVHYEKYIAKNNFYAYASVGSIYYDAAKYNKAIEYFEKASELNPSEFDQYYELGMAYKKQYNYQKAIIYLEEAIIINPNHYDANLQLGILYDIHPDWVKFYQEEYKTKPNYNRALELFKRWSEPH